MGKLEFFDTNNYEFNIESRDGIFIIHGFTNSTYETRDIAEYLGNQGYYTKAMNLPGHGTTPEDCNRIKYTDWVEFVEQSIAEMSSRCDNVYVVGISMGSVLALHVSSIFPLAGAVFASTVLEFKDYFGAHILTPLFHKLVPFREKRKSYPKAVRNNFNYFGYQVWPMSAVNEMRKLTIQVKKELSRVKCPALIIHSTIDMLSIPANIPLVYDTISSEIKEKLMVNNASHNLLVPGPDQDKIYSNILSFFNRFRDSS